MEAVEVMAKLVLLLVLVSGLGRMMNGNKSPCHYKSFTDMNYRNVSEPLQGEPQTNQRAELTAILRALQIVSTKQNLEIITDSNYSINCATVWYKGWMKNDWKTSTGGKVVNKDLVVDIRKLIDARVAAGVRTEFTWIKGHDNDPGNEAADRLAVAGAMAPR